MRDHWQHMKLSCNGVRASRQHSGVTDGRSLWEMRAGFLLYFSPLLSSFLVSIDLGKKNRFLPSVSAQGCLMCWIFIRCLAAAERERAEEVVGGGGWGSPSWLMAESSITLHAPFSPLPHYPEKQRDISSTLMLHKHNHNLTLDSKTDRLKSLKPAYVLDVNPPLLSLSLCKRWTGLTCQSQLQLGFDVFRLCDIKLW